MAATPTPGSADAIRPRPLHSEVADRLRDLITQGQLPPGERLNERQLTERFNISRTPLREAIRTLSSEGLVQLLPNRGVVVTTLTRADAQNLFQVLAALEALAGGLACERATGRDIDEVQALHGQMREHHTRGELTEYFNLNQRIHQKIVDCAQNPELADVYRKLSVRIRHARYMANLSAGRWDDAMQEHEDILDALVRRDSEALKALLAAHLENKLDVIEQWLEQTGGEAQVEATA